MWRKYSRAVERKLRLNLQEAETSLAYQPRIVSAERELDLDHDDGRVKDAPFLSRECTATGPVPPWCNSSRTRAQSPREPVPDQLHDFRHSLTI